jgi:hypothetical protein
VAFHCLDPDRLAELRSATDRAENVSLAPRILEDPQRYTEFLLAQDRLTAALDETWPLVRTSTEAGARVLVEDLEARLDGAGTLLAQGLGELDRSVEAYRAKTSRFPGSMIAGVAWRSGPPVVGSWISASRNPADAPRQ